MRDLSLSAPTVKTVPTWLAKQLRSIKTRIALSVLATLAIGIALTTLMLVGDAERDTLAAGRALELREGARSAATLSHRVVSLQRALAATAGMLDESIASDPPKLAAFMASQPILREMLTGVFVAAPDGRVLVSIDAAGVRKPQLNIADRDHFKRTLAEGRAIISEPLMGRLAAGPVVLLSHPLRNPAGIYGVIGGSLRLDARDLLEDLADDQEDGVQSLIVVTDKKGVILAHPVRARLMQSISTEPRMADGFADWLAMGGASGGAIEPAGLFVRQAGQVLTVAGVPGPDWLVWRAVPESTLLAPLRVAGRKAMVWAALIAAGGSLSILAILGWFLSPLTQLKHRAGHLFEAGSDVHAGWPDVAGEIGELARVLRHVGAERAQLEQFNAQILGKLESVLAAAPVGIMFTKDRRFELVSAQTCQLVGRPEHELVGRHSSTIFAAPEDYQAIGPLAEAAFQLGQPYCGEWRVLRNDGSTFLAQLRGQLVDRTNKSAGTIWTMADVSDQVAAREQLEWSASHDPLTGLGNRKLFEHRLSEIFVARPASLPAAILMIDLDRFKPVNDTAGHAAGDAMLKMVAAAIDSCVRAKDLVARLGGDEFAVLLDSCPQHVAVRIANSVREAISGAILTWGEHRLQVGASIGVACLSASTPNSAAWVHEADTACYEAKTAGRGVVRTAGGNVLRVVGEGVVEA